ncbi:DUF5984 family protein [Deinococcus sp.]|uniref:DUF5984 family protein n=1 Tax=Deinococcus sp. TaxID=47478 RepID=UPI003C79E0F7
MSFKIGFKLMDLDDLLARSTNPDPMYMDNRANVLKGLYILSLGEFWFEIDGESILKRHPDFMAKYPQDTFEVGIDYQALQLFTDIEEFLPVVLQSVPRELAEVVGNGSWIPWKAALDDAAGGSGQNNFPESYRSAVNSARSWWRHRELEFWYLVAPPDIHIWSPDLETVCLHWDTRNKRVEDTLTMIETNGSIESTRSAFLEAMTEFRDSLLGALSGRIRELEQRELIDADGEANLRRQLELYRNQFDTALAGRIDDEQWPEVISALRQLEPLVGPLF